jgi:hypothetical protein
MNIAKHIEFRDSEFGDMEEAGKEGTHEPSPPPHPLLEPPMIYPSYSFVI